MINVHAICHEAGHAIVAMKFGLKIKGIEVENSIPTLRLETGEASLQTICTVYAAGVAAERIAFGGYNYAASAGDRCLIEEANGGKLEDYLNDATEIIEAEIDCLKQLRMEMVINWAMEDGSAELHGAESDRIIQPLLGEAKLKAIWDSCHRY